MAQWIFLRERTRHIPLLWVPRLYSLNRSLSDHASLPRSDYIYRSSHSQLRKFMIHILIIYQALQLIFSWFAIGNYFIAFYVLTA